VKVAIVGSRFKIDPNLPPEQRQALNRRNLKVRDEVERYVRALPADAVVISGGAIGVDTWAANAARARGLVVVEIPPDYQTHGPKRAPLVRNVEIAKRCERMAAFSDGNSTGTGHALGCAARLDKPTETFTFHPDGSLIEPPDRRLDSQVIR
jgi:hypothetical protein